MSLPALKEEIEVRHDGAWRPATVTLINIFGVRPVGRAYFEARLALSGARVYRRENEDGVLWRRVKGQG